MENEYTLYKGNEIIAEGTIKEIARQTGLKEETVRYYQSPSYQKKSKGKNHKELVPLDKYSFKEMAENKTSHWIERPHESGENWEYSMYECYDCHEWSDNDSNYCPNCGAKMKGGK